MGVVRKAVVNNGDEVGRWNHWCGSGVGVSHIDSYGVTGEED